MLTLDVCSTISHPRADMLALDRLSRGARRRVRLEGRAGRSKHEVR
jgi:hypothetical protein